MKTSVEATGKNIEQAIENALFELKAPREDVDIKILTEGGLFKKAKVVVTISDDVVDKYEKREKLKKQEHNQTGFGAFSFDFVREYRSRAKQPRYR